MTERKIMENDNELSWERLDDTQKQRAIALTMAAEVGRATSPMGRTVPKYTAGELVYLADFIIRGEIQAVSVFDDAVWLPRELAAHAAVALAMSPAEEDQEVARQIEIALTIGYDNEEPEED